jgi:urease gamma subunit
MSKPQSISSLLVRKEDDKGERGKHQLPRQSGIPTKNRFLLLAEKGKAARERSLSAKRFRTDSECTVASEIVEECDQGESVFASMEVTERQLKEAKTVIDQVKTEVEKIPDPGPLKTVLDGLLKWMALTTSIQENSASVMLDEFAKASKKVSPPPRPGPLADRSKEAGSRGREGKVSRM